MSQTPTGMLSLPPANLRTALSRCTTFQTWTGAANETEALEKIGLVERAAATSNFAVVDDGDAFNFERIDTGATFDENGSVILWFQGDVSSEDAGSETDAQLAFTNAVGAILEELIEYCGNHSDVFNIAGGSKLWGPSRTNAEERTESRDYMQIGFLIKWQ